MQFSSRYDERRLPARSSFSPVRCFKALVDWFDYAYAAVPAAGVWLRNPMLRLQARHSPAVIHLRGPFAARARTHEDSGHIGNSLPRRLGRLALFAILLAGVYVSFGIATGGPSRASAPTVDPSLSSLDITQVATAVAAPGFGDVNAPSGEPSGSIATPVKTLQSAVDSPPAAAATVAAPPAETAQPSPAPVVVAAAVPPPAATAAPESPAAVEPVATPAASAPAVTARINSGVFTSAEIRAFAAAAGWENAHLDDVVKVAWCESTNNSAAIGGAGAYGLMQILPFWFRVANVDFANWADPVVNLKVALVAYKTRIAEQRDPWSAWDCKPGP